MKTLKECLHTRLGVGVCESVSTEHVDKVQATSVLIPARYAYQQAQQQHQEVRFAIARPCARPTVAEVCYQLLQHVLQLLGGRAGELTIDHRPGQVEVGLVGCDQPLKNLCQMGVFPQGTRIGKTDWQHVQQKFDGMVQTASIQNGLEQRQTPLQQLRQGMAHLS